MLSQKLVQGVPAWFKFARVLATGDALIDGDAVCWEFLLTMPVVTAIATVVNRVREEFLSIVKVIIGVEVTTDEDEGLPNLKLVPSSEVGSCVAGGSASVGEETFEKGGVDGELEAFEEERVVVIEESMNKLVSQVVEEESAEETIIRVFSDEGIATSEDGTVLNDGEIVGVLETSPLSSINELTIFFDDTLMAARLPAILAETAITTVAIQTRITNVRLLIPITVASLFSFVLFSFEFPLPSSSLSQGRDVFFFLFERGASSFR